MKTYKITIPSITQTIEAKSKKEALAIFWDNFDTYNEAYPQDEDAVVSIEKNDKEICRHCGKVHKNDTAICN